MQNNKITEFWNWFSQNQQALREADINDCLGEELDSRIMHMDERLNWELRFDNGLPTLIISPNYNDDLLDLTRLIIAQAPKLDGWKFLCFKPPQELSGDCFDILFGEHEIAVNLSTWSFVVFRYADASIEVLISSNQNNLSTFDEDELWIIGSLVLSGILGEEFVMQKIHAWSLQEEMDPEYAPRAKKLIDLKKFFMPHAR